MGKLGRREEGGAAAMFVGAVASLLVVAVAASVWFCDAVGLGRGVALEVICFYFSVRLFLTVVFAVLALVGA